jgi:hypothetical protein
MGEAKLGHAHEVIGGSGEGKCPTHPLAASESSPALPGDLLQPSKDLLNPAAAALGFSVAHMPRGSPVDVAAPLSGVLCHLGCDSQLAQAFHKGGFVLSLIGRHTNAAAPHRQLLDHL